MTNRGHACECSSWSTSRLNLFGDSVIWSLATNASIGVLNAGACASVLPCQMRLDFTMIVIGVWINASMGALAFAIVPTGAHVTRSSVLRNNRNRPFWFWTRITNAIRPCSPVAMVMRMIIWSLNLMRTRRYRIHAHCESGIEHLYEQYRQYFAYRWSASFTRTSLQ